MEWLPRKYGRAGRVLILVQSTAVTFAERLIEPRKIEKSQGRVKIDVYAPS